MVRKPITAANEELAELIAGELVEKGLVPRREALALRQKLIQGSAKAPDWRLWIEMAADSTEGEPRGERH